MNHKQLAESYKRAIDSVCSNKAMQLTEDREFCFKIKNEEVKQVYKKGFVIPDVSEDLLLKWVKINYMVNQEYINNKEAMEEELKKVGL